MMSLVSAVVLFDAVPRPRASDRVFLKTPVCLDRVLFKGPGLSGVQADYASLAALYGLASLLPPCRSATVWREVYFFSLCCWPIFSSTIQECFFFVE